MSEEMQIWHNRKIANEKLTCICENYTLDEKFSIMKGRMLSILDNFFGIENEVNVVEVDGKHFL